MEANMMDNLKIITANSRIRYYLTQFSVAINPYRDDLRAAEEDIIEEIPKALSERNTLVYELYCLKVLKGAAKISALKLNEISTISKYRWKIDLSEIKVQSTLDIFPFDEDVITEYRTFVIKIYQLVDSVKEFDEVLMKELNLMEQFALGLAFMNTVYLMYTRPNFEKAPYCKWYNEKQTLIASKLGVGFSILLKFFIENFPQGSIMHLNQDSEIRDTHFAMIIGYTMLVGVVFASVPNQFSSQFLDSQKKNHSRLYEMSKSIFFIGAEPVRMHDYLKFMRYNFDALKSKTFMAGYAQGGSYVCSDTCDYLYIIYDCGGAMVEANCPFCGQIIGGRHHQIFNRPGHRNLTDQQALEYLDRKILHYKSIEPTGFNHHSTNVPQYLCHNLKNSITFMLLNTFSNSMFDFLSLSGLSSQNELQSIYSSTEAPILVFIERLIVQNLTDIYEKIKNEDLIIWILATIKEFRMVMMSFQYKLQSKDSRDRFENEFEERILSKDMVELVNSYKKGLSTQTSPSLLINYIEEGSVPTENEYSMTHLFRYTIVPSWQTLKENFNLLSKKQEFQVLNYFISNFNEIRNLQYFWSIIDFAKEMVHECSFTISRTNANTLKIEEFLKTRPHFQFKFKDFCKSWERLRLVLRFDCKVFEKMTINKETPIGYLLVDTDINSLGIQLAACLRNLAEIQNGILGMVHSGKPDEQKRYSIFSVNHDDLFQIASDELDVIVQSCSNNYLDFGRGQEVFYDWERLNYYIVRRIEKARFIDCENLQTVQYQFELLHARSRYAGIISEIRNKLAQSNIGDCETKIIEKRIRTKAIEYECSENQIWSQVHTWLEKILINVRHAKSNEHQMIQTLTNIDIRFENDYRAVEVFHDFKIEKFLSIYEFVELQMFDDVVIMINEQYKIEFENNQEVQKEIEKFCGRVIEYYSRNKINYAKRVLEEIGKVVRRIILRLLTANTDPVFKIVDYIGIENYWNFEFINEVDTVVEMFPEEICLEKMIKFEQRLNLKIRSICQDPQ